MSDDQLEARIAEILHYPIQDRIPEAALASLCVWWLKRRGVLSSKAR